MIQGSRNPNAAGTGPLPIVIAGKGAIGAMMLTIVEVLGNIVGLVVDVIQKFLECDAVSV